MIVEPAFIEDYIQERRIQKQIGSSFGYLLSNQQYQLNKTSAVYRNSMPKINTKFKPMMVTKNLVEPSARLKELNQQIYQIELQKKINAMAEKEEGSEIRINDLLNEKIEEYNYIIDHKHFTDVKEDSAMDERMKGKEVKSQIQVLAENIRIKNRDFHRYRGPLRVSEEKSKKITLIYKDFSSKIIEKGVTTPRLKNSQSQSIEKKSRAKPVIEPLAIDRLKLVKSTNNSPFSNREPYNVKEPYISQEYISQAKKIEREAKQNRNSLEVWRNRLEDMGNKNKRKRIVWSDQKQEPLKGDSAIKCESKIMDETMVESLVSEIKPFEYEEQDNEQMDRNKQMKENILSSHLKKKNSRYLREAGNKFVKKFDSVSLARSMLEGVSPNKEKPEALPPNLKRMYNRNLRIDPGLSEEEKYVFNMMIEDEDDKFYWTASRNEKVNLLLKGKKHS